ncbi:MAG: hypothetical protein P4L66_06130 [Acetobacteraceae bacterium]|nr:hypothetical protein [Acetobacteraceae bacterium]
MCDINTRLAQAMAEDLRHRRPMSRLSLWQRLLSSLAEMVHQSPWRMEP